MGRRHAGHKFMPGKFVFPGGRIETGDRSMPWQAPFMPRRAGADGEGDAALGAARPCLALAAIRETFEETGLMLGTNEHGAPDGVPAGPWSAFREHGVFPILNRSRWWRAPSRRPASRRFDTRFFAVDRTAIAHEVGAVIGPHSELVELAWVTLPEAKSLELPIITLTILEELEDRIEKGFAPDLPVPFYYERRGRFLQELI